MNELTSYTALTQIDENYQQLQHLSLNCEKHVQTEIDTQAQLVNNAIAYTMYGEDDFACGTIKAIIYRVENSQLLCYTQLAYAMRLSLVLLKYSLLNLKVR